MSYRKQFIVVPANKVRLSRIDPHLLANTNSPQPDAEMARDIQQLDRLQYLLYADVCQSLLIVLQALDAAGKDGVIRHLFSGMNPQRRSVFGFKQQAKRICRTSSSGALTLTRLPRAKWSCSTDLIMRTS
jgi:polyphosphate kinase 2 (PPK2 family)